MEWKIFGEKKQDEKETWRSMYEIWDSINIIFTKKKGNIRKIDWWHLRKEIQRMRRLALE